MVEMRGLEPLARYMRSRLMPASEHLSKISRNDAVICVSRKRRFPSVRQDPPIFVPLVVNWWSRFSIRIAAGQQSLRVHLSLTAVRYSGLEMLTATLDKSSQVFSKHDSERCES